MARAERVNVMQENKSSEPPSRTGVRTLFPSCRDVSRLQSVADVRPLSFARRLGLRLHLLVCSWCRRYGRQMSFLRNQVRDIPEAPAPMPVLSEQARERVKRALQTGRE